MKKDVLRFISIMRDSFIGSQQVYTEGSCFHFYRILKEVFPRAEPFYNNGHVITYIDGSYYDITGEVLPDMNRIEPQGLVATASLNNPFNIYKNK